MTTLTPTRPTATAATPLRHGQGRAVIESVRGQSVVVRDSSTSPLKLLCPKHAGPAAWVYTSGFGGGLVAGDVNDIELVVGDQATGVFTTQAASKVFHQRDGLGCRQNLHATVGDEALLVVGPDPVTCFADARYEQVQEFDLHASASLLVVDWQTSGREAMGERWAFDRYASRNDVRVGGRLTIRDAVRLDASEVDLANAFVTGGDHCLATVLLVGPRFETQCKQWRQTIGGAPLDKSPDVLAGISPLDGGIVLRLAGRRTQHVAAYLQDKLAFLTPLLGRGLWDRKW